MKKTDKDLIYFDDKYKIYKKNSTVDGTDQPIDGFNLIRIGIAGVSEFLNAGFFYKKDLVAVVDDIKKRLDKIVNEFQE